MKIALVSMPFHSTSIASIQLGLLKSLLNENDIEAEDHYLNLSFAKQVGFEFFEQISCFSDSLIGDWLFSKAAFETDLEDNYLKHNSAFLFKNNIDPKFLLKIRNEIVPRWLENISKQIDWKQYDVVGFSCTFMQTVASIALTHEIKKLHPSCVILFGGSSMEGEMGVEISKNIPAIDCVLQGEGENAIFDILSFLDKKLPLPKIYSSNYPTQLDQNPEPNYDSYFELIDNNETYLEIDQKFGSAIPFESSRGCWWGQKKHCTFCGLNGQTLSYRKKDAAVSIREVQNLSKKYNRYTFQAVDNILSMDYFDSFLPALTQKYTNYDFFFEVKSNLSYEKLKALKNAGVHRIQPGIESLDTSILKLMNKGVSGSQNLSLLKNAQELDIEVAWNFLYGFPSEKKQSYQELLTLIPKITHLQPPTGASPIRMDRFSPYFEEYFKGTEVKFENVRPSLNYNYVYPKNVDQTQLAYFFEAEPKTDVPPSLYQDFCGAVENWVSAWKTTSVPSLTFKRGLGFGHVVDKRTEGTEAYCLDGLQFQLAEILEHRPLGLSSILAALKETSPETVVQALEEFKEASLVVELDQSFVWLPVSNS